MLRFDLAEIIRTPGMVQVYDIHEPPFTDDDVEYVSPITGRVTVTNTGAVLLIRGPMRTTVSLDCSRCLEPLRVPIEAELEEVFDLKPVENPAHRDHEVQVIDDEVGNVFDGKILQLAVLIRQAVLLAAPLQPLCREDCPGIPVSATLEEAKVDSANSPFHDLQRLLED